MKKASATPRPSAAGRRGTAEEDETIALGSLSCPILAKIWHAFHYAKKAVFAEKDGDVAPGSRILRGGPLADFAAWACASRYFDCGGNHQ
jgi:hypothetical protein